MATRKQVEKCYQDFTRAVSKAARALREAERLDAMEGTETAKYRDESPFWALWELNKRGDAKFKTPIANAVMSDIKRRR